MTRLELFSGLLTASAIELIHSAIGDADIRLLGTGRFEDINVIWLLTDNDLVFAGRDDRLPEPVSIPLSRIDGAHTERAMLGWSVVMLRGLDNFTLAGIGAPEAHAILEAIETWGKTPRGRLSA